MRFTVRILDTWRELVLTTVNVVTQYWVLPLPDAEGEEEEEEPPLPLSDIEFLFPRPPPPPPPPPQLKLSLEDLINNKSGVPFVRSARARSDRVPKVSCGIVNPALNLRQTVAGIRASGAVTHAGARTESEALLAAHAFVLLLVRKVGVRVGMWGFAVKNVVSVCLLNFPVDMWALHARLGEHSAYVPEGRRKFPMVRYPSREADPTAPCRASISQRGAILIVGAPNWSAIGALLQDVVSAAVFAFPGESVPRLPPPPPFDMRQQLDRLLLFVDVVAADDVPLLGGGDNDNDSGYDADDETLAARALSKITLAQDCRMLTPGPAIASTVAATADDFQSRKRKR